MLLLVDVVFHFFFSVFSFTFMDSHRDCLVRPMQVLALQVLASQVLLVVVFRWMDLMEATVSVWAVHIVPHLAQEAAGSRTPCPI